MITNRFAGLKECKPSSLCAGVISMTVIARNGMIKRGKEFVGENRNERHRIHPLPDGSQLYVASARSSWGRSQKVVNGRSFQFRDL